MEGGAAIQIDAVDINALVEQVLDAHSVASTGHEEKMHGVVKVLGDGEVGIVRRTSANGIERGLAAEAEPEVVTPGV